MALRFAHLYHEVVIATRDERPRIKAEAVSHTASGLAHQTGDDATPVEVHRYNPRDEISLPRDLKALRRDEVMTALCRTATHVEQDASAERDESALLPG